MTTNRTPRGIRVLAVCFIALTAAHAQTTKQLRPGEFELYNEAIKDINTAAFAKAIDAISSWTQKFPETDYANERAALSAQAFAGSNQPAKALDAAAPLLSKELNSLFTGDAAQAMTIRLLYNATWAITHIPAPTATELAAGDKAAHELMRYDTPLPGVPDAKWAEARADMKDKANAALLYIAMLPGIQAMAQQPPDCAAAEAAYVKALAAYPDKAALSYELGRALSCAAKADAGKFVAAIWYFQRAAVLDATLGDPRNDPAKIRTFADSAYTRFHGGSDGLDTLKQQVKASPIPPADFRILSAAEVADAKQKQFETDNPQLAMWMRIKARLLDDDGAQYFESDMKGAVLPALKGRVVEAKPACRPKELLIAIDGSTAEVSLKLDKALNGKPQLPAEVQWQGEAEAFTKSPFLLGAKAEAVSVQGLALTPCSVTPRK